MSENFKNDKNINKNNQIENSKNNLFNEILNSWFTLRKKYFKNSEKQAVPRSNSSKNNIHETDGNFNNENLEITNLSNVDLKNLTPSSEKKIIQSYENTHSEEDKDLKDINDNELELKHLYQLDLLQQLETAKNENAILKAQLSKYENIINNLQNEISKLNDRIASLSAENITLQTEINEKVKPLLDLTEKLKIQLADEVIAKNQLKLELEKIQIQVNATLAEKQKLDEEVTQNNIIISELQTKLEKLEAERELLKDKLTKILESYKEILKQKEILESEVIDKNNELVIYKIKAENQEKKQNELEKLKHQALAWQAREKKLIEELEKAKSENNLLRNKLNKLLIGVKEYISYPLDNKIISDPPIPTNACLLLPLCFPENIYKQLKILWRISLDYKITNYNYLSYQSNNKFFTYLTPQKGYYKTTFLRPSFHIKPEIKKVTNNSIIYKTTNLLFDKIPKSSIISTQLSNYRYSLAIINTKTYSKINKFYLCIENFLTFRIFTPKLSSYLVTCVKHLSIFEHSLGFFTNYLSSTILQTSNFLFKNLEYKVKLAKLKPFEGEMPNFGLIDFYYKQKQSFSSNQDRSKMISQIIVQKIKKFDIYSDIRKLNVLFSSLESTFSNIIEKYIEVLQAKKEKIIDK